MKVKRFLSVITAVIMMLVFTGVLCPDVSKNISVVQTCAADTVNKGDVNLDGTVDSQDLIHSLRSLQKNIHSGTVHFLIITIRSME